VRIKAWSDYPLIALGDRPYELAPVREINVVRYDGNKYTYSEVPGIPTLSLRSKPATSTLSLVGSARYQLSRESY
jgi:hypothetical protein